MAIERERLSPDTSVPKWVWLEHVARYEFGARFVAGQVVVDCACGAGIGSETFARNGAKSVAAFDVSESDLEAARRRMALPNLAFQRASGVELPLTSSSVDVYISFETIEHVSEDHLFLREVRRIVRPEGLFICSTPNRTVTNPGKAISDKPWNPFHVREYSHHEFVALLSEFFNEIVVYGQNPKPEWLADSIGHLGRLLPLHGAVRLNQVMKLPQLVFDNLDRHAVQELIPGYAYEYLVAVCRGRRHGSSLTPRAAAPKMPHTQKEAQEAP